MLPDIYYFNPTCELAIANGSPWYTAPARLRQFEADLAYLPAWLGSEKDQVVVGGRMDPSFRDRMRNLGFCLPHFLSLEDALKDPEWLAMPKGRILPWGWSPAAIQVFKDVIPSCSRDFRHSQVATWQSAHPMLFSRLTACSLLSGLLAGKPADWMPGETVIPEVCNSPGQAWHQISRHARAVVKTPWSASGRGLLLFPNVDTRKKNEELLNGMFRQQGFVTVEPWLDKVADLSFQFYSYRGKIGYMGRTFFETDHKGRYLRTFLADASGLQEPIPAFIDRYSGLVAGLLEEGLQKSGYATLYEGWIGVDSMVFLSEGGELKFHPVIEINGRFTMGAIALKLRQFLASGSGGYLQLFYSKSSDFLTFSREQEQQKPLVMKEGKIVSGFMPLTPPLREHRSGAWIEVVESG